MLNYLKTLFETPRFEAGDRVNQLSGVGNLWVDDIQGTDGHVLTQTEKGVLVEWPRSGARWVNPHALCQQV